LDVCALTCNLAYRLGRLYIISPSNSIASLFNPPVHVWVGVYLRGISILHVILGNKTVRSVESIQQLGTWHVFEKIGLRRIEDLKM
jgi:hypothetical protein